MFISKLHYQTLPDMTPAFSLLSNDYNAFEFKGNRTEQVYSVQQLPSCATVSANIPINKSLSSHS